MKKIILITGVVCYMAAIIMACVGLLMNSEFIVMAALYVLVVSLIILAIFACTIFIKQLFE